MVLTVKVVAAGQTVTKEETVVVTQTIGAVVLTGEVGAGPGVIGVMTGLVSIEEISNR